MSRPMYEQAIDLAREHDMMQQVTAQWGVQYYKLPMSYRLDFILMSAEKPKALLNASTATSTGATTPM